MINIKLIKDKGEFYRENNFRGILELNTFRDKDYNFMRILEMDKKAFWDDLSIDILKEIDKSVRIGNYGIKTMFGESCISCIASGLKLALIIILLFEQKS